MKKEKRYFCILCFFVLAAVVFLECCAVTAFVWAGFNGFGDVWLEYTSEAENIFSMILFGPLLFVLLILAVRMIIHFKQKAAVKYYFYDILFCAAAIGVGFFFFYCFGEPRETIMNSIKHIIRESDWLYCPAP